MEHEKRGGLSFWSGAVDWIFALILLFYIGWQLGQWRSGGGFYSRQLLADLGFPAFLLLLIWSGAFRQNAPVFLMKALGAALLGGYLFWLLAK